MTESTPISVASMKMETAIVVSVQFLLVIALVQAANAMGFEGALSALIGALFIFLPVIVLDRRGKPYERYGMKFQSPLPDFPMIFMLAAITWPPIVAAVFLFPEMWQLQLPNWTLNVPAGYVSTFVAHFLVVALPEEFFFRGYLLGRLDDIFTGRITILGAKIGHGLWISSLVFAVGHFSVDFHASRLLVFFPALAFGYLKIKRNSIIAPIIFHGLCNVFMDIFRSGLGL
ncbi:MAG: CPBP family intramembrane metalloprotease [Deltaproteobacteria bacterium]|nr:CPBP family intramembrane metalloprotease [Deltaproteobacteria bacterium]MBN2673040.1 CPBP family intramembrane metalloprotease [Deltaproteobacteria bacterium]